MATSSAHLCVTHHFGMGGSAEVYGGPVADLRRCEHVVLSDTGLQPHDLRRGQPVPDHVHVLEILALTDFRLACCPDSEAEIGRVGEDAPFS